MKIKTSRNLHINKTKDGWRLKYQNNFLKYFLGINCIIAFILVYISPLFFIAWFTLLLSFFFVRNTNLPIEAIIKDNKLTIRKGIFKGHTETNEYTTSMNGSEEHIALHEIKEIFVKDASPSILGIVTNNSVEKNLVTDNNYLILKEIKNWLDLYLKLDEKLTEDSKLILKKRIKRDSER